MNRQITQVPNKDVRKTGNDNNNNNNTNNTLIINRWRGVDTTALKKSLKDCSCGKIIEVDFIKNDKCSCDKSVIPALREYIDDSASNATLNTNDTAKLVQKIHEKLKRKPPPYVRKQETQVVKQQIDANSVESEVSYDPNTHQVRIGPNEHSYSAIRNTNSKVNILTGKEFCIEDLIIGQDLADNNQLFKIFIKIEQPRNDESEYGPVDSINLKILKNDDGYSLNKNMNANTDDVSRKREPKIIFTVAEETRSSHEEEFYSPATLSQASSSSLSFHSILSRNAGQIIGDRQQKRD